MKLINWRLAIIAIFLLATACKKHKTDIGLGLQENLLQTTVEDSTEIASNSFKINKIRTDRVGVGNTFLIGNYTDPLLGGINTSAYTQVMLSAVSPTQTLFDSIIESSDLTLTFDGYTYGEGTGISIDVFEITGDFPDTTTMYSNQELMTSEQSLVDVESANYQTTYLIDSIYSNAKVTIPLNDIFTNKMLNASADVFSDNTNFVDYFKGIKIVCTNKNGRVVRFRLQNSKITVKYQNMGANSTSIFDFPLSENLVKCFTHIDSQYNLNFDNDTLVSDEYIIVQSGGGIASKVSFIDLIDNHLQGEIVNKAELVLPYDSVASKDYPIPSTMINAYLIEEADTVAYSVVEISNNEYRINLTEYVQEVVNRNITNTELYLVANNDFSEKPHILSVGRLPIYKDLIKLRIIHTE